MRGKSAALEDGRSLRLKFAALEDGRSLRLKIAALEDGRSLRLKFAALEVFKGFSPIFQPFRAIFYLPALWGDLLSSSPLGRSNL